MSWFRRNPETLQEIFKRDEPIKHQLCKKCDDMVIVYGPFADCLGVKIVDSCYRCVPQTPGCKGCGYNGPSMAGVLDSCDKCEEPKMEQLTILCPMCLKKEITISQCDLIFQTSCCNGILELENFKILRMGPKMNELTLNERGLCANCEGQLGIVSDGNFGWYKRHEDDDKCYCSIECAHLEPQKPKMKCTVCKGEYDYCATYSKAKDGHLICDGRGKRICIKCVKEIRSNEVNEFDLRPFEVKHPKRRGFRVRLLPPYDGGGIYYWDIAYEDLSVQLLPIIDRFEKDAEFRIYPTEDLCRLWTFADIKVGWFFKDGAGNIGFKVEDDMAFITSIDGDFKRGHYYKWSEIQKWEGAPTFYVNAKITNIYDCPEFAKVLMIERVIT